jgi:hypothetical protein
LAARCYAASALSAQRFENAVQMIWDIQAVITELAELGAHEAILELEGIHRALADDFGGTASPTQEVRIRLARALSEAEANLGDAASGAIATGRAVPAAERGARIVQLVEQATAEVAGRW